MSWSRYAARSQRCQLLQQDEESERQRIRLLGRRLLLDHHRLGQPRAGVGDAGGPGRIELVEAEAGDDGDEIGADRLDRIVPPAQPTDGCVLDDVLRVGGAAQHAIGDAEEQRAPLLEGGRIGLEVRRLSAASVLATRIGISQLSENPWLRRPSPALKRDRKFSSATQAASSTNSASLRWARMRAASSSETSAGLPVAVSAYSSTTRSRSSKRSLVRQLPTARTLAGSMPRCIPS